MIFLSTHALKPIERKIITEDDYDTLIDFLQEYYPNGFDKPTEIYNMFKKIELDDYDMKLHDDDVIILVERPAFVAALGAIGITGLWATVINAALMMAINFAVSKLFAPDVPDMADSAQASTVYSLNNAQNSSKLGAAIPVGYGTFRMYPSYVENPYSIYTGGEEYLYLLLSIGMGRYRVDKLMVENMDVTHHPDVEWKIINKENFSNITGFVDSRFYKMRTNVLAVPYQQTIDNHTVENYYEFNPNATYLEFDFSFDSGLYQTTDNGDIYDWAVYIEMEIFDANKNLIKTMSLYARSGDRTPYRITGTLAVYAFPTAKYFSIRRRVPKHTSIKVNGQFSLYRAKEIFSDRDVSDYPDMTLLWVKMKATNAISSAGQQRVNGFFTRTDKGNRLDEVLEDIYTNKEYGAGLNKSDLHLPVTTDRVNGVFESKETIFDAMRKASQAQKYTVYASGKDILLKHDEPKTTTMALYNETNILKGSFSIQYSFKDDIEQYDCYEVTYRTGADWNPEAERYPDTGILPKTLDLFGVTDSNKAKEMARYLWKQEAFRNKVISFDTDIQFMTLEFLDKIKVSHSALMWGEAGQVEEMSGSNIIVSDEVASSNNITFRNIDGSVSDMLTFTKVSDFEISVHNMPTWVKEGTFYTIGVAKEFLVVEVTPKDENTATVRCVEYNEDIYT